MLFRSGYQNGPGTAGALGCEHHHDLYSCAATGSDGCAKPAGSVVVVKPGSIGVKPAGGRSRVVGAKSTAAPVGGLKIMVHRKPGPSGLFVPHHVAGEKKNSTPGTKCVPFACQKAQAVSSTAFKPPKRRTVSLSGRALSFASERLCSCWHGISIQCVFRQPIKLQPAAAHMIFC